MKVITLDRCGKYFGSAINYTQWASNLNSDTMKCELVLAEDGPFRHECLRRDLAVEIFPLDRRLNLYGREMLRFKKMLSVTFVWIKYNLRMLKFLQRKPFNSDDVICVNNYRSFCFFAICLCLLRLKGIRIVLRIQTSDMPVLVLRIMSLVVPSSVLVHGTEGYARRNLGVLYRMFRYKLKCFPNPVDVDKFRLESLEDTIELRRQIGIPKDAYVFVTVSSIEPRKGVLELFEEFARLNLKGSIMIHVGDCSPEYQSYNKQVDDVVSSTPNILKLGRRNDVERILSASDCFVLYSQFEGMPYAIVEAMACGLPIIATSVGANPDFIDEDVGVLLDYGDNTSLAEAMRENFHVRHINTAERRRKIRGYVLDNFSLSRYLHDLRVLLSRRVF